MSSLVVAKDIAERSLRAIHAFPITESAADPEDLREAMHWLSMILDEAVGVRRMFTRLTPTTLSMAIENGTTDYDLYEELGDDVPDDGIQYVINAWLEDDNENRSPLTIAMLDTFENVSLPTETGTPTMIYLTREEEPTLRIYPTPDAADSNEWTLKLACQRYAPNVTPAGVLGTKPSGTVLHGFGRAWQRWMVCQLAHDIGAGPVRKIGEASLNRFIGMANSAKADLLAFENRPHDTEDPICQPWGIQ